MKGSDREEDADEEEEMFTFTVDSGKKKNMECTHVNFLTALNGLTNVVRHPFHNESTMKLYRLGTRMS